HLTRSELNSEHLLLSRITTIKIITDQHRSAESVGKAALEVDLLGDDSVGGRLQLDESASDGKRPSVHISVTRDRRENLGRPFDNILVAPEELTRLRINSDNALAQKLHVLFTAAALQDNR